MDRDRNNIMIKKKQNMNNIDLVSVIVPLYNKALWVERCIQSIIDQTYQNIEILIVNDGSTDNGREVVAAIDDSKIKIYDKSNGGVSSARNLGIEKAKGEYIAFLDADDEWLSSHIENILPELQKVTDVVLTCDQFIEVNNNDEFHNIATKNRNSINTVDYIEMVSMGNFYVHICCVLFNKSLLKKHNIRFCKNMKMGEDINFILQVSQLGRFVQYDSLGFIYHHDDLHSAMTRKITQAQLTPLYFYGIDVDNYNKKYQSNIKKFLLREYYKKAFQNRGLPLRREELSSQIGGGVHIRKISGLVYLAIRYCPQFIFTFYKKVKTWKD